MKKIILIFGTRPEAIKMCPVVKELKKHEEFEVTVCVTGQHREMLEQVLEAFEVVPDYDLAIMQKSQTLFDITEKILEGMRRVYEEVKPDIALVHGDTSTAFAAGLAAFYMGIPVGHVEAGLRTYNAFSPYPEEFNRQAIDSFAKIMFAPTKDTAANLEREGKNMDGVYIVGNTGIDALNTTVREDYSHPELEWTKGSRFVLLTAHRRENLGAPMRSIMKAIKRVLDEHPDVKIIYPVHPNPAVVEVAKEVLGGLDRVHLIDPLDVLDFHNFIKRAEMVLTDSGGIQEEAPSLGKPVLVLRDTTERPEGVAAGTLKLVGTDEEDIYREFTKLLDDKAAYEEMSHAANPYGDGHSSEKIAEILKKTAL